MSAPGGVIVHADKYWRAAGEPVGYEDLNSAGAPIFELEAECVGTEELDIPSIIETIGLLGGPGLRGVFTMANPVTIAPGAFAAIGTITTSLVTSQNDIVDVAETPSYPVLFEAWIRGKNISIGAENFSAAPITLPAGISLVYIVYPTTP